MAANAQYIEPIPYTLHGPPAPDDPPCGESLLREYDRRLGEYQAIHQHDRPGIPADQRERLAAAKLGVYQEAAVVRAKAVNDFLTLLRWCREDSPGTLETILRSIVDSITAPDFIAIAKDVSDLRLRRAR